MYSKTADRIKAAVRVDSGSATEGTFHTGNGWEELTVPANIGDVSSTLEVGLTATSGATFVFYADEGIGTAGASEPPRPLGQSVRGWHEEGDEIVFDSPPNFSGNITVIGDGVLSSLSVGSDTMELGQENARFLYSNAAELFFQQDIDQLGSEELNAAQRRQTHFANRVTSGDGMMVPGAVYKGLE